jgi:hypothetical protein
MAAGGLKLRAVLRKTRLPVSSAFQALTMDRSAKMPAFEDIGLAVELLVFLALGDDVPTPVLV